MTGLDVRVNTDLLTEPVRLGLTGDAFAALIALQAYALSKDTDGFVEAAALQTGPRWLGIPWTTEETLQELEEAGLVERDAAGVQVNWDWQTTAKEREEGRERKRRNKREQRARDRKNRELVDSIRKQKAPAPPPHDDVTGDAPETHRRVGKDRSGIGKKEQDSDY